MGDIVWKHDSYEILRLLYERLNRLLEDSLIRYQKTLDLSAPVVHRWEPPIDIYEDRDHYVVVVEVSGLDLKTLKTRITRGTLVIRGERRLPGEPSEEHQRMEITSGHFERRVDLPPDCRRGKVVHEYENGLLILKIPRSKLRKKKK